MLVLKLMKTLKDTECSTIVTISQVNMRIVETLRSFIASTVIAEFVPKKTEEDHYVNCQNEIDTMIE